VAQGLHLSGLAQGRDERLGAEPQLAEPHRIVRDGDAGLRDAARLNARDSLDGREPRVDLVLDDLRQRTRGVRAGHRVGEQGLLVELLGDEIADRGRQGADRELRAQEFEPLQDGQSGERDVGVRIQLDRDLTPAIARLAARPADATHRLDRRLHRRGEVGLDQFRWRARPAGADPEPGQFDPGLGGERQAGERHGPGGDEADGKGPDDGRTGGGPADHAVARPFRPAQLPALDHRIGRRQQEEGHQRGAHGTADHAGREWLIQLAATAPAEHERQDAHDGGDGGHRDGPEALAATQHDRLVHSVAHGAEPADGVELDHRIVVRDADHHHQADERHRVQTLAREPEEDDPARRRQRHGGHHQQGRGERRELAGQHQEDQRHRQQGHESQLAAGAPLLGVRA
jgi:hypothetical protein